MGNLVCMNLSSNKKYIAKIYNQGQDWQVIISENGIKVDERWFSRYEPIKESMGRPLEFAEKYFDEHGAKSDSVIFP